MNRILIAGLFLYGLASIAGAGFVFKTSFENELAEDRAIGQTRLSDSISRLIGQLDYYRAIVNFVSQDPNIANALRELPQSEMHERLATVSLTYGVSEIDKVDRAGIVSVSSVTANNGKEHARELVRAAFNGRLGRENVLQDNKRAIRMSRALASPSGSRDSAIVMTINLADLEFDWPVSPEPIYFVSRKGGVLAANRPELLLLGQANGPTLVASSGLEAALGLEADLWDYVPAQAVEVQMLSRFSPQLEMTAHILLNTDRARQAAGLRGLLVLAGALVLGLSGTLILQQRRRLALESQHSATLESRVADRTAELRAAQDELVEASNLAALGRLSAGLSHELNQPLAAILNFAENGKKLMARGDNERASENLGLIGDQVRRITRIIGNLRTFARQEALPKDEVDLTRVVRAALALATADIDAAKVRVETRLPDGPVAVIAGQVRLEQVVLNLINNAIDAMATTSHKVLSITLETKAASAVLRVSDTGSGLEAPERVFEPFYTTKELGASKGLGMGLALSFGIIQSFGGQLTCENTDVGADFVISIPLAETS